MHEEKNMKILLRNKACIKVIIVAKDGVKRPLFLLIKIFRRITNFCSSASIDWISLKQSFLKINL